MARQIAAKVCTDGETVMDTKFFVFSASKPYFYTSFWEDHILNELNIPCKNVELKEAVGKRIYKVFVLSDFAVQFLYVLLYETLPRFLRI